MPALHNSWGRVVINAAQKKKKEITITFLFHRLAEKPDGHCSISHCPSYVLVLFTPCFNQKSAENGRNAPVTGTAC